jgi:hypothetical protein
LLFCILLSQEAVRGKTASGLKSHPVGGKEQWADNAIPGKTLRRSTAYTRQDKIFTGKEGKAMLAKITRWMLLVGAVVAVAVTPALSWASINHNETLVRE